MPWNIQSDFICKEIENNLRDYHYHINRPYRKCRAVIQFQI